MSCFNVSVLIARDVPWFLSSIPVVLPGRSTERTGGFRENRNSFSRILEIILQVARRSIRNRPEICWNGNRDAQQCVLWYRQNRTEIVNCFYRIREYSCKGTLVTAESNQKSVLIVDDEEAILFAFKDILSGSEISVDTAQSIDEVRTRMLQVKYDGAVIDLRLSGTDSSEGFEVLQLVKQHNPECVALLLTAYARPGTREEALSRGADLFFEKPVSPEEIGEALRSRW
jgi:CheY-like chemotaxis protein